MPLSCPQCEEPIGWDRRVHHLFSRSPWTCPRCSALLRLQSNFRYSLPLNISLIVLTLFLLEASATTVNRKWLVVGLAVCLLFIHAVTFAVVRVRMVRPGLGYCQHCNYDLRGLSSDRCPECGNPIVR